jgi:DNA repair exonuclease SbcCD ATPase subunit
MRLMECYIENFGKLSSYHHTFTPGINEILDENGWGKTTLAAFIKVMLYGFDDEKKRTTERERKKYEPWQGGTYGGRLTFQNDEGTFTICRTFGAAEKGDEFKLIDAATGIERTRYGKEVGRELLHIDRDTFFSTLFISQADHKVSVTDDIHARIGSQDHILEDISGYQDVEQHIKDALNHATPKRKGGSLYEMKNRILQMRQDQTKKDQLESNVKIRRGQLETAKEHIQTNEAQIMKLQEERAKVSTYEGLAAKKDHYEALLAEERKRQEELEQARRAFPGRVPQKEECMNLLNLAGRVEKAVREEELCRLTEGEKEELERLTGRFREQTPSQEEIEECGVKRRRLQNLRMELAAGRLTEAEQQQLQLFEQIFPQDLTPEQFDDELEQLRRCARLQNTLQEQRMTLRAVSIARQEQHKQQEPKKQILWQLPAAALAILLGLVLMVTVHVGAGAVVLAAGLGLLVWGIAGVRTSDTKTESPTPKEPSELELLNEEIEKNQLQLEQLQSGVRAFLAGLGVQCPDQEMEGTLYEKKAQFSQYQALCAKRRKLLACGAEAEAQQLCEYISSFLQRFSSRQPEKEEAFESALKDLEADARLYTRLCQKQQNWQQAEENAGKLRKQLQGGFEALSLVPREPVSEQLQMLYGQLQQYEQCVGEAGQAAANLNAFSEQEDVEALVNLKPLEQELSVEELDAAIRELEQDIHVHRQELQQYETALQQSNEELDQLELEAEHLSALEEQYEAFQKQYARLERTQAFLAEAKTNLTNRYTAPLLSALKNNYEILANGEECHYSMDANMKVSLDIGSMPRELSALSMGYQDLSWICMRLAFIEAMYQEEKPFLIMDDPFVNMDEEKIAGGKKLLEQIADNYQVIYFTCHASRSVSAGKA